MKYTIFSIDDSRKQYKDKLENQLLDIGWEYQSTEKVNGAHSHHLLANIERHGYRVSELRTGGGQWKVGQLGIWYTVLNSFEMVPHVTFEDDAILGADFSLMWEMRFRQMPNDTDFFSLFIPRDSDHMYNESLSVSRYLTRTYQRYGGVSMYYTEQGVDKIRKLLERDGIRDQYDDTLYAYSKAGELNGYCSKPTVPDLVYITGKENSIVQESDIYVGS